MTPLRRRPPSTLEERLGYRFRSLELLEQALTHRSFAHENGLPDHYERLEFLGDAVLGLMTAEWLFEVRPDEPEGELSRLKSQLVSTRSLARHAERLGLGDELRVGVGEERSGGRSKRSLLADALEAIFGALWIDGGVAAARPVVRALLVHSLDRIERRGSADSKTLLQEAVQARGWALPEYRIVKESGPDHHKHFEIECRVRGETLGEGAGPSKKTAEQEAAAEALERLPAEAAGD